MSVPVRACRKHHVALIEDVLRDKMLCPTGHKVNPHGFVILDTETGAIEPVCTPTSLIYGDSPHWGDPAAGPSFNWGGLIFHDRRYARIRPKRSAAL